MVPKKRHRGGPRRLVPEMTLSTGDLGPLWPPSRPARGAGLRETSAAWVAEGHPKGCALEDLVPLSEPALEMRSVGSVLSG